MRISFGSSKHFRRRGIGKGVMQATEQQARALGLSGVYLWTESWQAPAFYQKLGYERFVEFEHFLPGHQRLGFRKYL